MLVSVKFPHKIATTKVHRFIAVVENGFRFYEQAGGLLKHTRDIDFGTIKRFNYVCSEFIISTQDDIEFICCLQTTETAKMLYAEANEKLSEYQEHWNEGEETDVTFEDSYEIRNPPDKEQ